MKISVHLGDMILIRGEKIAPLIKNKVFGHLQKCFDHISEKVDKYAKRMMFAAAFKKIDE